MITEAAIFKEGKIYHCGIKRRHSDVILSQPYEFFLRSNSMQGFIDECGKFYNRREAAEHAYQCGQIKEKIDCLISEDLW